MKRQSLRNAPATRIQNKLSILSIATGVALMTVIISIGVFLYLNVGTGQATQAGTDKPLPNSGNSGSTGVQSNEVTAEAAQALSFSLLNTNGDVLMQQLAFAGNAAVEVNLPQLPAGLYVMSVKGMKAQTQKFTVKLAVDKQKDQSGLLAAH